MLIQIHIKLILIRHPISCDAIEPTATWNELNINWTMLRSSAIHCVDSNCLQVHSTGCLFGICRLCVCVCMRVFYSVSAWIKTTFFLSSCNVRITINAPLATLSPQHSTPPLRFFFFFAAPSCGAHKIKLSYCHFFPKKHVPAFRSIKSFEYQSAGHCSSSCSSSPSSSSASSWKPLYIAPKWNSHKSCKHQQCLRSWRWCKRSLATQRDFHNFGRNDFMTQSEPKLSLCPPLVLPRRDTYGNTDEWRSYIKLQYKDFRHSKATADRNVCPHQQLLWQHGGQAHWLWHKTKALSTRRSRQKLRCKLLKCKKHQNRKTSPSLSSWSSCPFPFFFFFFFFLVLVACFFAIAHMFWMLQHPIWPFGNQQKCCACCAGCHLLSQQSPSRKTRHDGTLMWTQCGRHGSASAASSSSPSSAPSAVSSGAVSGAASAVSASRASCNVRSFRAPSQSNHSLQVLDILEKSLKSFISSHSHVKTFIIQIVRYCRYLKWFSFYLRMFKNFTCVQMPLLLSLRLHHPLSFS